MELSRKDIRLIAGFARTVARTPHVETIVSEAFETLRGAAGITTMRIVHSNAPAWKEWMASVGSVEVRPHDECPAPDKKQLTALFDPENAEAGYVSVEKKGAETAQLVELLAPAIWSALLLNAALQRAQKAAVSETEMVRATIRARDEERRHIARELHDDLGQSMASLKLNLKWAEDLIRKRPGTGPIVKELEGARDSVGVMLSKIRDLSHTLYPRILDTLGLASAVRELGHQVAKHSQTEVQCEVRGKERPLEKDTSVALYRCCQEAVSNVIRHADASKLDISIRFAEKEVHVSVEDNGKGFNPRTLYGSNARLMSSGFWTIRQRMTDLGGAFRVSTASGRGTVVEMVLSYSPRKINGKRKDKTAHRG